MKLTEKQKKLVWVAGGVLVAIHYAPGIVNTVRQQIAAYSFAQARPLPNPAAGRVSSAPPSPAPPPPAPSPEEIQATQLAASVGIWGGAVPRPNLGMCQIRIELKPNTDKTLPYLGYSTISCANLLPFRPGQRTNPANVNDAMLDAVR